MVDGSLQWCGPRECTPVAPEGVVEKKKLSAAQECACLTHRAEIGARKKAHQDQLRLWEAQLRAGTLSDEEELRMVTAQHGVPVILMSPAVTGGKSNDYRPLATVDVGFISEHTLGAAALYDSSAWHDEPAMAELFRPGRRDDEFWTVSNEPQVVPAGDVHLAKSAEDLALFMTALGPKFWKPANRGLPRQLPGLVAACTDRLFVPIDGGRSARMEPGGPAYKKVISQKARVAKFPDILHSAIHQGNQFPGLKAKTGALATKGSTRWNLLRELFPSFKTETDGRATPIFGYPCLEAWFYEEWLGSHRRAAAAAATVAATSDKISAAPPLAAAESWPCPDDKFSDAGSCDNVNEVGQMAAYLQDQLRAAELQRKADFAAGQDPAPAQAAAAALLPLD